MSKRNENKTSGMKLLQSQITQTQNTQKLFQTQKTQKKARSALMKLLTDISTDIFQNQTSKNHLLYKFYMSLRIF